VKTAAVWRWNWVESDKAVRSVVFRLLESCMVTFREDMVTPEAFHTIMHVMNKNLARTAQ
jgi:hypothetical protein